ncbi:MAG: hypothetical protein JNM19_05430 [Chitinophagaceae bacterium]|nr:hypothetical protein [Chitinophagaceae bacterium]
MKTKSLTPVGSLHPILFFAVVYAVALVLSIFICSSLFYSCNASSSRVKNSEPALENNREEKAPSAAVVMR